MFWATSRIEVAACALNSFWPKTSSGDGDSNEPRLMYEPVTTISSIAPPPACSSAQPALEAIASTATHASAGLKVIFSPFLFWTR